MAVAFDRTPLAAVAGLAQRGGEARLEPHVVLNSLNVNEDYRTIKLLLVVLG